MGDPDKVTGVELKTLRKTVEQRMKETAAHYGLPEDDLETDRFKQKLKNIELATTRGEADRAAQKAVDSVFWHCLSLMANKLIRGPLTPSTLEKKAKQAENLADFQEKLGNEGAAAKQRERAERLKIEATDLRTGKTVAPPPPGPMPRLSPKRQIIRRPIRKKVKDLRPRRK
jgi:hypothetical protein